MFQHAYTIRISVVMIIHTQIGFVSPGLFIVHRSPQDILKEFK